MAKPSGNDRIRRAAEEDWKDARLADEAVELAAEYGTPLYLFDEETIRQVCRNYKEAFAHYPQTVQLSYASKAFLNKTLAHLLLEEGFGFDACRDSSMG